MRNDCEILVSEFHSMHCDETRVSDQQVSAGHYHRFLKGKWTPKSWQDRSIGTKWRVGIWVMTVNLIDFRSNLFTMFYYTLLGFICILLPLLCWTVLLSFLGGIWVTQKAIFHFMCLLWIINCFHICICNTNGMTDMHTVVFHLISGFICQKINAKNPSWMLPFCAEQSASLTS